MKVFQELESDVRSYCRSFPAVFDTSQGAILTDVEGREYLDFFAGAGALNYGHNNPRLKSALLSYIERDGVTHSLDMATDAKGVFMKRFEEVILEPRGMSYLFQFPGPTGTNAVEAALKLARKVTGRTEIVSFTNGFHGMTLGSLSVTGNSFKRTGAGVPLANSTSMPFDSYLEGSVDSLGLLRQYIDDKSSGLDLPAAFIVETIQAEGGVNVASEKWLRGLAEIAAEHDILLIVDDIQVGCGRTGPFFSFEGMGIEPDIICLSKSLSGYGLPFAVTLIKPEHDVWEPGEHNGTFRGHNLAFVTATAALDYWEDRALEGEVGSKATLVAKRLVRLADVYGGEHRGRGLIQGIAWEDTEIAGKISKAAFERGLIIEVAGPRGEVLKLLPPITIETAELERGLDIIEESLVEVLGQQPPTQLAAGA